MSKIPWLGFLSVIFPFLLLPVEKVLPYPYLVEELAKLVLIAGLFYRNKDRSIKWVLIFGVLFTLSETVLFSMNLWALGTVYLLLPKFLGLVTLHCGTLTIMWNSFRKGIYWVVPGICLSIFIHFVFNLVIA
ncbi:hypothetical protein A3K34_04255 [candidate division WWE3 bacterium RIFOXYC1_FULL_40_10]|uniref:PrsW family intramembrane metalloprotease n=1 Tax=candidate division WWE3 bacterium RIFOXYA2_FULL_46_9 TaxID=1802636 RepID=A0A1F4W0M2_UNCKA|nr:MAG: hypothetical protein A3K58_04255 [candidate division WWE3 bacterium RIFOXYB1_FULL_40_22]OGC62054.1 MAG: hypothetical protein A3K37_04255 [candidate division WWE3 bacterium RIFOXYA1_FULL_40_11]OGC62972.1 MAG: hypothetical protein A2264_03780 [candidate division WWE3 bacterium RIFOXYA2_FULL_46_9]OGC65001.1 MAG: hypothetical protein A2326_03110 [candidate division WWE3 bacterium RIFOXYB2_FULL_41_6]OGC66437.1 MAG: hypothetical protein A3K34_04255 [candidate division WWE3 bacterium RIFOXYC1_